MSAGSSLRLDHVGVIRGGRHVVEEVSAGLPPGTVTAIVGPNGAGKSSLLGAIAGVLPASGSIAWDDGSPSDRQEIAYMPQSAAIRTTLSVFEVVLLGRLERLGWRVHDAEVTAAAEALGALGLEDVAERQIGTLSGGQQQLVLLAQQLARRPRLLVLDEPTSALDLCRQLLVLDHLAAYAREADAVVLVALHDLALAARYAAQILLLCKGRLLRGGGPIDVLKPETIRAAYGVEAEILTTSQGHLLVAPICATLCPPLALG